MNVNAKRAVAVVICTHNPRYQFLSRVLKSLKEQTLDLGRWELVVVDNASSNSVIQELDALSWHPVAKVVVEPTLGLTHARLKGVAATNAEIICFVDDDNVLDGDYLEQGVRIGEAFTQLGAWGGDIRPEWESAPPAWISRYSEMLALRSVKTALWSNTRKAGFNPPCGAGLFVRRTVAERYASDLQREEWRRELDRKGSSLISGGDTDLVYTSENLNLGWGVFPELRLTHLIPKERTEQAYILRLMRGITTSVALLQFQSGSHPRVYPWWLRGLWYWYKRVRRGRLVADEFLAVQAGRLDAVRLIKEKAPPVAS